MSALIEQVVVHLLRHYSQMRRSDELELSRVGLIDRRIRRAVEFMQAQLDQDLPLKEIAAASYLSPFHFARLFKKLTGTSPHTYLARLRSAQAKSLLAETDLSVTEISSRVGYASPSHFTKAFRQTTGLAPHQFVLERRIERAKSLLRETDLPIIEIAHRIGCASHSHFSVMFRRATGQTPRDYRN